MLTKSEVSACNVLGVEPYAPFDEVKRAYHALVKECHPDLHPDDEAAEALFKRVQAAYETLDAAHREGRDAKPNAQYNPFGGGYTGGAQQGAYTGAQQGAYTGAQQSPYGGGYAAGAQQGAYTGAQRPYGQAGAYGAGSQAQSGSYTQPGSGAGGYTGGAQQPPFGGGYAAGAQQSAYTGAQRGYAQNAAGSAAGRNHGKWQPDDPLHTPQREAERQQTEAYYDWAQNQYEAASRSRTESDYESTEWYNKEHGLFKNGMFMRGYSGEPFGRWGPSFHNGRRVISVIEIVGLIVAAFVFSLITFLR